MIEKKFDPNINNSKEFPGHEKKEDAPILVVFINRHGPKLSAEGEKNEQADYFNDDVIAGYEAMNIKPEKTGLVGVKTSDIKRAVNSSEIIKGQLEKTRHRIGRGMNAEKKLAVPFQDQDNADELRFSKDLEKITQMQKELNLEIQKEIEQELPDADKAEREAELRNRLDMKILNEMFLDETRDKKKFQTSYQELADRFAMRYAGFARHLSLLEKMKMDGRQPSDEPYVQIDVTHSFPIMSFLKKYLVFEDGKKAVDMDPGDFFDRTGGIIRESGNFKLEYSAKGGGELSIRVEGEFAKGRPFKGSIDKGSLQRVLEKNNSGDR